MKIWSIGCLAQGTSQNEWSIYRSPHQILGQTEICTVNTHAIKEYLCMIPDYTIHFYFYCSGKVYLEILYSFPFPMSTASRKLVRRIQSGNFMEILFPSPWVSGWGVVVIWLCAGHLMIVFIIKPQIQTPGRPRAKTGCCLESSEQQSIMCHFVPAHSDLGSRVLSANCY